MNRSITAIKSCCSPKPYNNFDFQYSDDQAISKLLESILKEAIKTSNDPKIWDKTLQAFINEKYPGYVIISCIGDLSLQENNHYTYEVKIFLGDHTPHWHRIIDCKITVSYTTNQDNNTRNVKFLS